MPEQLPAGAARLAEDYLRDAVFFGHLGDRFGHLIAAGAQELPLKLPAQLLAGFQVQALLLGEEAIGYALWHRHASHPRNQIVATFQVPYINSLVGFFQHPKGLARARCRADIEFVLSAPPLAIALGFRVAVHRGRAG